MADLNQLDVLQQDLFKAILAAMPEPFFVYDENGKFIDVLGGSDRGKYHDARHLIGKTLHEVFGQKTAERYVAQIRKALNTGTVVNFVYSVTPENVADYQGRLGPAGQQWFEAHISPIKVETGQPRLVVWMAFNITQHKKALELEKKLEKRLQKLALTDPLTGLLNRRGFLEKTRLLIGRMESGICENPSVFIVDIDHFKAFNDTYGHHVGDFILKNLAKELTGSLRPRDVVARVGGEEFAIVLSGCQSDLAQTIAERLRLKIASQKLLIDDNEICYTVSIGISTFAADELDIQNALKRADAAMYRAKVAGRNRVCLYK
jgi:diguanylate cyclase (GGDEF)-like protein/PAS domain S-box-containing protein